MKMIQNHLLEFFSKNARKILSIILPETDSSHLKIDGWKMNFLLGWPIFRAYGFRECIFFENKTFPPNDDLKWSSKDSSEQRKKNQVV